jgi:capsular exopolysaccharide synthesis family protein
VADAEPDETALVGAFVGRIRVAPLAGPQLVDVSFTADDPEFAARAVNALVEGYVAENLERLSAEAQGTLIWLEGELKHQRTLVEQAEHSLAEYRASQNALSLGTDDIVSERLTQLNAAVTRLETTRLQKESLYNQVRDIDPNSDEATTFAAVAQNQAVQEATLRVNDFGNELTQLGGRYGLRHPKVIKVQSNIAAAREQLRLATAQSIQTIYNEYQSTFDEEQRLKAELQRQEQAALDLGRKNVRYSVLERDAASIRRVYDLLLQQQKELQVANNRTNNVRIVDRAQVPGVPFTPNTRRDWYRALMAGLVLALGLVFSVEYLDETIRTPGDVARSIDAPFLGLVPNVGGQHMPLLSGTVPHEFGEALRALRTSLVFASTSSENRIVALTSAQPLEGKTTSASNLALGLALGGMRVLLIDADMRRPSVHKGLGVPNATGLSQVLVGQVPARDAIQQTRDPNLFVLSAGQPPPNPSELLASNGMKNLLKKLEKDQFDWVLIDTPPVLAVTDAAVVASMVAGVVFVVRSEMTSSRQALQALDVLQASANPRIIGVVLNRVNLQRDKYYYSRYYGRHFKDYYATLKEWFPSPSSAREDSMRPMMRPVLIRIRWK